MSPQLVQGLLRLKGDTALRQRYHTQALAGAEHYDRRALGMRMLATLGTVAGQGRP